MADGSNHANVILKMCKGAGGPAWTLDLGRKTELSGNDPELSKISGLKTELWKVQFFTTTVQGGSGSRMVSLS